MEDKAKIIVLEAKVVALETALFHLLRALTNDHGFDRSQMLQRLLDISVELKGSNADDLRIQQMATQLNRLVTALTDGKLKGWTPAVIAGGRENEEPQ